jgi:hypothetical protein
MANAASVSNSENLIDGVGSGLLLPNRNKKTLVICIHWTVSGVVRLARRLRFDGWIVIVPISAALRGRGSPTGATR